MAPRPLVMLGFERRLTSTEVSAVRQRYFPLAQLLQLPREPAPTGHTNRAGNEQPSADEGATIAVSCREHAPAVNDATDLIPGQADAAFLNERLPDGIRLIAIPDPTERPVRFCLALDLSFLSEGEREDDLVHLRPRVGQHTPALESVFGPLGALVVQRVVAFDGAITAG